MLPSSGLKSVHFLRLTHAPFSYLKIREDTTNTVSEPPYVSHRTKQFKVYILTKVYEMGLLSIDIAPKRSTYMVNKFKYAEYPPLDS